ncbi:MAG: tripartite tricarboxylate transporter permease [Methanophagales archaeon]|nr:tripartite tricarboxylate transporter permease [Methanophagales archaeon]
MLGVFLGTLTGLIPGFHPNNVAVILVSISPVLMRELHSFDAYAFSIIVASAILAMAVTHTFLSFIPAAFIGAPEADTALSLLPAHRLLLEGRVYEATVLSAIGSFGAVIFSLLCLIPFYFIVSSRLFAILQSHLLYLLIGISAILILTESSSERMEPHLAIMLSTMVFIIAGIFGIVLQNLPVPMYFPAFTGLFGLSTILYSLFYTPEIPPQEIKEPEIRGMGILKSIVSGAVFGSMVSILPGITSAHATVMAMLARRNREPEQVILTLSGVNTANVIFCTATLFLTLRARSGTMIAINRIMEVQPWEGIAPHPALFQLLIAVLTASAFSFFITRYMGKQVSLFFCRIPYRKMLFGIIISLTLLVFVITGWLGLLVLFVATTIGLIPIYTGVKRSNCMGVLLLPIIIVLFH